jgi:hypothetical protein
MNLAARSWNLLAVDHGAIEDHRQAPWPRLRKRASSSRSSLSAKRMDNPSMVRIRVSMGVLDEVVTYSSSVLVVVAAR